MGELLEFNLVSTGVKTMAMLFIVLALLVITLYLFKRFTNFQANTAGDISIKTLSSLALTPKDKLQVVQIEDEKIVVGVSPSGIKYITKINPRVPETEIMEQNKDEDHA